MVGQLKMKENRILRSILPHNTWEFFTANDNLCVATKLVGFGVEFLIRSLGETKRTEKEVFVHCWYSLKVS